MLACGGPQPTQLTLGDLRPARSFHPCTVVTVPLVALGECKERYPPGKPDDLVIRLVSCVVCCRCATVLTLLGMHSAMTSFAVSAFAASRPW